MASIALNTAFNTTGGSWFLQKQNGTTGDFATLSYTTACNGASIDSTYYDTTYTYVAGSGYSGHAWVGNVASINAQTLNVDDNKPGFYRLYWQSVDCAIPANACVVGTYFNLVKVGKPVLPATVDINKCAPIQSSTLTHKTIRFTPDTSAITLPNLANMGPGDEIVDQNAPAVTYNGASYQVKVRLRADSNVATAITPNVANTGLASIHTNAVVTSAPMVGGTNLASPFTYNATPGAYQYGKPGTITGSGYTIIGANDYWDITIPIAATQVEVFLELEITINASGTTPALTTAYVYGVYKKYTVSVGAQAPATGNSIQCV